MPGVTLPSEVKRKGREKVERNRAEAPELLISAGDYPFPLPGIEETYSHRCSWALTYQDALQLGYIFPQNCVLPHLPNHRIPFQLNVNTYSGCE